MITEDYVSFEIAKLLKEKGFNERCISVYHDGELQLVSSLGIFCSEGYGEQILTYTNSECEWSPIMISAPTLQMAMKWLRDVQGLNIYALGVWKDVEVQYGDWEPAVVGYNWFAESLMDDTYSKMSKELFLTYEQACEAAIKYCLENLV